MDSSNSISKENVIYVGDPMCSWCWGIAPELKKLREFAIGNDMNFSIVVGGLRPGGGDPWDAQMKEFLEHHWNEVLARTGQPFGYDLFKLDDFNYDTEPACRAVVAARPQVGIRELEFFENVQRKFYVESQDPGKLVFYQSICEAMEISFDIFSKNFNSEGIQRLTNEEFIMNRKWGVKGYPTVLFGSNNELKLITNGYISSDVMIQRVQHYISEKNI